METSTPTDVVDVGSTDITVIPGSPVIDCNTEDRVNQLSGTPEITILNNDVPEVNEPNVNVDDPNNETVVGGGKHLETVDFKVIYKKQKYDVTFPLDNTLATLKQHIQTLTGVPAVMQKIVFKGLAKEDKTLRELGVIEHTKLMVVGSTLNDVLAVNTPADTHETDRDDKEGGATASSKEPLCKQKLHKKIIDKGLPDDVMLGIKNEKDSLPPVPLSGMLNKGGGKVRLTFKLEVDQLWIGTKERTDKIPMNSIKNVTSEPIEGHEEYHILGIQLGPTEASRYWIYWVPSQYIEAIKDAILGKWQAF